MIIILAASVISKKPQNGIKILHIYQMSYIVT